MIIICCIIAILLLFQFKTEFWLEYCKLFHLDIISKYKGYELKKSNDVTLDYIQYIRQYHDCFFVRLITCPICLATWLGIIAGVITCNIIAIPIYIVGGLLIFSIINRLLD